VQNLYNFLFEACNIIRGPVSQDNFKDYITPILYYKRISDVYDEEKLNALQESALEAFDKIFPKKVKEYNESQLPPFAEKAKWLREHGYSLELK
jgi:type I restriction-modification system DNA methylase subunit